MEHLQTDLTPEQKEKLIGFICQTAVCRDYLNNLEELAEMHSDLESELQVADMALHSARVRLAALLIR